MNGCNLTIFEDGQFAKLRDVELGDYVGFIYILQYGDRLKIGYTKNPYQRLSQLKRQAIKYHDIKTGRIALSKPHTNYRNNERTIHEILASYRKEDTELFNLSFEAALDTIENISICYQDDSDEMRKAADAKIACLRDAVSNIYSYSQGKPPNMSSLKDMSDDQIFERALQLVRKRTGVFGQPTVKTL